MFPVPVWTYTADFKTWCLYFTPVCTEKHTEHIKRWFTWHLHITVCALLCQVGVVFISGQPGVCRVSQHWGGSVSGPVYHPSYLSPRQPPLREAKRVYEWVETCEVWTRMGETTTEGQEEGDDRWQARRGERKEQREGGQWGERERETWWEGWQVIVAVGVTGSRWHIEEKMKKCIDIPHQAVSSHSKESLWL